MLLAAAFLAPAAAPVTAEARQPSEAIYPVARHRIRFSHAAHHEIRCESCHASVRKSIAPRDRNLPAEAACRPCHSKWTRKKDVEKTGDPRRCGTCHQGYQGRAAPRLLSASQAPRVSRYGRFASSRISSMTIRNRAWSNW